MQRLQPELKRLQAKYKGDRVKLNEEMMKFYKEHNFNPLSGCLPVLLQAPLFIVLYRLVHDLGSRPPKHLPPSSQLYKSLVDSGGKMISWGIDLGQKAGDVQGFGKALPFYLMVAFVVATGYYQQRQLSARMPAGSSNAQMQMIGKVFPVFIGLISLSIPAGVVVYFIVSNLWQISQQAITFRQQGPPPVPESGKGGGGGSASPPKPRGSGPSPKAARPSPGAKGGRATPKSSSGKGSDDGAGGPGGKGRNRPPASPRPKGLPPSSPKGAKAPKGGSNRDK
jgi:YidC/Oxa1 family membrane protein insertase